MLPVRANLKRKSGSKTKEKDFGKINKHKKNTQFAYGITNCDDA